ncbi:MAG: CDP-alcohol phosphatidyltransferase family protein [Nitriliruptorales bacterium]|nr:CDP-alcohol phosphatidyltransferase family protein [Nitriliruptorales bacterium]
MALKANFASGIQSFVSPVGRAVGRTGITPNQITTFGLVLTSVAAWLVAIDRPVLGGWVLVVGGLMDTLDGAVARARGSSTPFGGFWDSVSDRLSDGIILGAIAYWMRGNPRVVGLAMFALVTALTISYVRAKAEAIDLECDIGLMERAERAVLIMAALVFHRWALEPIMWLLAVGGVITVIQRIHHVWCQIDRDIPEELLALTMGDRAWNRAFTSAARRFFGEQNFDSALQASDQLAPAEPGTEQ